MPSSSATATTITAAVLGCLDEISITTTPMVLHELVNLKRPGTTLKQIIDCLRREKKLSGEQLAIASKRSAADASSRSKRPVPAPPPPGRESAPPPPAGRESAPPQASHKKRKAPVATAPSTFSPSVPGVPSASADAPPADAPPLDAQIAWRSCCMHGVTCERSPGGRFCSTNSTARGLNAHPYLFGTIAGRVCSPCRQRVQYTRESLRVLSLGNGLKAHSKLVQQGWAREHPALDATHGLGPKPLVLTAEGFLPGEEGHEEVCAVCVLPIVNTDRSTDLEAAFCGGKLDGRQCPLAYHIECLRCVGRDVPEAAAAASANVVLRSCPYCEGCVGLAPDERSRMLEGYSLHTLFVDKAQRQARGASSAKAAMGAATEGSGETDEDEDGDVMLVSPEPQSSQDSARPREEPPLSREELLSREEPSQQQRPPKRQKQTKHPKGSADPPSEAPEPPPPPPPPPPLRFQFSRPSRRLRLRWADGASEGRPADVAVRVVDSEAASASLGGLPSEGVLATVRFDETTFGLPLDASERELRAHEASQKRARLRRQAEETSRLQKRAQAPPGERTPSEGGHALCRRDEAESSANALQEEVKRLWIG